MAKGRPRSPGAAARGTGRKHDELARVVAPVRITAPRDLAKPARAMYVTICTELAATLRPTDLAAVKTLCETAYYSRCAAEYIAEHGVMIAVDVFDRQGEVVGTATRPNPALKIHKETSATYLRLADALGLTPSSRMRLGLMKIVGASLLSQLDAEMAE
jgi:P27 family predicted phage terminase small subunit